MENRDSNLEEIIEEGRGIKCKICGRVFDPKREERYTAVNVDIFPGKDYYDCYDCPNCGSQAAVNKRLPREKGDTI